MAPARSTGPVRDLGLLIARVVLGVIFTAHGYQKVVQFGLDGVTESFRGMGVPAPEIVAPVVAYLELVGGILLILGAFTAIVGIALAIDMFGAALLVHLPQGLFIDAGGWELVGALGAGALALAAVGAGSWSVDRALFGRRSAGRRAATS
ncbi:DoxX family protein [Brachybacterium sp. YJGR34]|uniref:DoxX family protein n=1 Tax=Brachybacterium sp. YJGR34 TaxID=2059911 RepID=UPI000E0A42AA|nr:DoxX family protein [Brachybacterium sp. YJGR34]